MPPWVMEGWGPRKAGTGVNSAWRGTCRYIQGHIKQNNVSASRFAWLPDTWTWTSGVMVGREPCPGGSAALRFPAGGACSAGFSEACHDGSLIVQMDVGVEAGCGARCAAGLWQAPWEQRHGWAAGQGRTAARDTSCHVFHGPPHDLACACITIGWQNLKCRTLTALRVQALWDCVHLACHKQYCTVRLLARHGSLMPGNMKCCFTGHCNKGQPGCCGNFGGMFGWSVGLDGYTWCQVG